MFENKKCILIVDDEIKIIQGLRDFFNAQNFHVLTASHGQEAIVLFEEYNNKIDLILLDVMMPVMDGYETLEYIRNKNKSIPIVMLTAKSQPDDELKGFELEVDDYIAKPFLPSLLMARIDRLFKRGPNHLVDDTVDIHGITILSNKQMIKIDDQNIDLTKKEFLLLECLIKNKGKILSREQLINLVWTNDFNGDVRTIDTHIKQLRLKLGHLSKVIKTAHGVGYLMEDDNENIY